MINFAKRNFKELTRDVLSLIFAVILPLLLLIIFQQFNIPSESYRLENFTPGIIIFGFSFITMFTATLIAKDRATSLLIRLGVSPMRPIEYIGGYMLSLMPIIILQIVLFYLTAVIIGLHFGVSIIFAGLTAIAVSIMFIANGILIGSIFSDKASSGVSSIVVQLVCFTSGMYFPREMLGKVFGKICEYLPFESALTIVKAVMNSNIEAIRARNIIVFITYTAVSLILSVIAFRKNIK